LHPLHHNAKPDPHYDKSPFHLILLAENMKGWRNLLKIASASQLEGFYYKPRIDHDFLAAHSEGLIGSTACISGEVPRAILNHQEDKAIELLDFYFDVFGKEHFFLEFQRHDLEDLEYVNQRMLKLSKRYNAYNIATNDAHYVDKEDAYGQEVLLAIQTNALLSDTKRMKMNNDSYYIRPPAEMKALFKDIPGAIENTIWIAERCEVDLTPKGYHLPEFSVPDGYTDQTYLRKLCDDGLVWRYGEAGAKSERVQQRLEYELDIIHTMGFNAYFLIVWDLCRYSREKNIWYNTRGSGAGSIVAYSLAVTLIEPLDLGLIFERFLNPGRVSMPDIDLDFQDDKRAEIMEYCANKYGSDKVASIITFGTLGAKAAIRDVGRVMDIPLMEVDRIAKMIPPIKAPPLSKAKETIPDLKEAYENIEYVKRLIDTAEKIEGVVRNVGTHAAGVVVTDVPIVEYAPLHRPTSNSEDTPIKTVCQFEMSIVDSQGLLKVDFLGLSTLTVMQRACDKIEKRHGIKLSIDDIPIDDPETYAFLSKGNTAGVFQLEGGGMTKTLVQMQPQNLRNVIALVSLYRPGPMQFIPDYLACMHGEKEPSYRHPDMEPIFAETYGIPVYQEQIMNAVVVLANYTPSESDDFRKAISKKKKKNVEKHRIKFIDGCVKNNIEREIAEAIFKDWEAFASYGFNKSHAADYALVAVQTAYLKCHYTVEYMAALISVYDGNIDKVSFYVNDCREQGIDVLPPMINKSGWDFTIEDEGNKANIRYGMGAIKNVGHSPAALIVDARKKDGPFNDLTDFTRRVDLKAVGKRAIESLIRVGALDEFGSRRSMLEGMERIIAVSASHFSANRNGQMSFFGISEAFEDRIELPPSLDMDQREVLQWERELLGLFVSAHPMDAYVSSLRKVVSHYSGTLTKAPNKKNVIVAGIVTRCRPYVTKKGAPMAFAAIEDTQGVIELVVFPRAWKKFRELLEVDKVVIISGGLDRKEGDTPKVLVDRVKEAEIRVDAGENGKDRKKSKSIESSSDDRSRIQEPTVADYLVTAQTLNQGINTFDNDDDIPFELEAPPESEDWGFETVKRKTENKDNELSDETGVKKEVSVSLKDGSQQPPGEDGGSSSQLSESVSPKNVEKEKQTEHDSHSKELLKNAKVSEQSSLKTDSVVLKSEPVMEKVSAPVEKKRSVKSSSTVRNSRAIEADLPRLDDQAPAKPTRQKLFITLHGTSEPERDRRRLRRIYGELQAFPGDDKFAFYVFENKKRFLVDFPNDTTGICPELMQRLRTRVGDENIHQKDEF